MKDCPKKARLLTGTHRDLIILLADVAVSAYLDEMATGGGHDDELDPPYLINRSNSERSV